MTLRSLVLLAGPLLMAACTGARTPQTTHDRAVAAACRQEVDRVYAAQNRADLSRLRDGRDEPFAATYNEGVVSRGLGARFGFDNDVARCVRANNGAAPNQAAPPGVGPAFSPTSR